MCLLVAEHEDSASAGGEADGRVGCRPFCMEEGSFSIWRFTTLAVSAKSVWPPVVDFAA
jgi:hypothetical protein